MQKVKNIILVSRPISWPNTAFPFAAGYVIGGGQINLFFWITTFFFLFPYNLMMYGVNDIFDYESDIRNPRKGGIEGLKEQKSFHPLIAKWVVITCLPLCVYILLSSLGYSAAWFFVLIFLVLAYSVKGLRFKEIPVLDSITSSFHFVGPLIFASTIIGQFMTILPYTFAFLLWGMASHALGAIQDILPDRQAKIQSVATYIGAKKTLWASMLLYFLASLTLFLQGARAYAVGFTCLLYVINIAGLYSISDKSSMDANKAWRRFIWLNMFSGFIITITLILIRL